MPIKILYVEDEEILGKVVSESLIRKGFDVNWVADGGKALIALNKFKPSICILDLMLPNKNGYEIAADIKSIDANLPIILLTAKTQTQDVLEGFKNGANDYIKKPFSIDELEARILNLISFKSSSTTALLDNEIKIGSSVFCISSQSLLKNETKKQLTFKETEILKLLCLNKNSITTKDEILKIVWGSNSFFNNRSLDVYLTRIRSYFKNDESVTIITIKNLGYKLIY